MPATTSALSPPSSVTASATMDLSGWPSEWPGVQFKTSNPSVLSLDTSASSNGAPTAHFTARQMDVARIDATSADGRYTFELRVTVFSS